MQWPDLILIKAFVGTHCQWAKMNFLGGAPEPAPTNDSGTPTYTFIILYVPTFAFALLLALLLAFTANSTARYWEKDFQQIFKTVLEAKAFAPAPQPLVFFEKTCKKFLKVKFSDLYCNKTYIECYNFCQQCKDYFATAGAKKYSYITFTATFF